MNQEVMYWLILAACCFSHIHHAISKCCNCKTASRGFRPTKILDMDFLMDVHYPLTVEQQRQTAVKAYPPPDHFDHVVKPFLLNPNTNNPIWEHRGVIHPGRRTQDQSPLGKFSKNHADETKRDFLTMMHFRQTIGQSRSKQSPVQSGRHRQDPRIRRSLDRKRHTLAKRFFVSRKVHHFPKARRLKMDPSGNFSWTPLQTNGHLVNVTKRDTSNRRMKLSDILTRAGFRKDKEEAIKVVLPLLLSDLKDTPAKTASTTIDTDVDNPQSHVISSSSGKQSHMRTFKIQGDDGRELSFSATASDVQHLMDILAKPNSSVVLEKVTLDKNRPKTQSNRTKPPGRKKTSSHKAKDAGITDLVNNTEALRLKEFETSVYESIVQLDIPSKQSKATTCTPDSTTSCENATTGETTGG